MQGYRITTELTELDFSTIYNEISNSYWAKGIPAELLNKALNNSLCFGVLDKDNNTVAFARMITDQATFAYLADVFVVENERGKGISKWLVATIKSHPELQGLRRMMLATRDAHGLYQQFGFDNVSNEEAKMLMQIRDPDVFLR